MKDDFDDMIDDENSEKLHHEHDKKEPEPEQPAEEIIENTPELPEEKEIEAEIPKKIDEIIAESQEVAKDIVEDAAEKIEELTEETIEKVTEEAAEENEPSKDPEPEIDAGEIPEEVTEEILEAKSEDDGAAGETETEAEGELSQENVTEKIIEEVTEKVTRNRAKPQPKKHDDEAEAALDHAADENLGEIIHKNIDTVMHESMIPYSEFVIMDRALPRVEDGLKPVQRRILFAMNDMGLTPDKAFRKSAGIVGECLGKYHPHGDTSVYDAMVRLAQPFNMNMPLVIGQGNFGSDDGDPPAAMRYTEAKLSPLALELLRDIDKETVPFSLTFDDRNTEPDILPGRYPNLLTNGATGIAVGLATNIPPHNLAEVIDAHIAFIDNPKITLGQVMKIIKGPDFPTGGFIVTGEDLVRAYKDGKGKVIMRAKVHIEVEGNDRRNIVITELPYQVNKVTLQKTIAELREAKKGVLSGISEIRDESDRKGMRVVIKVRREFDAKEVAAMLFKYTNLQCNYNINMVAIAHGKPKLLGLLDFIKYYVEYQREIIYKRSVFDLENAKERAHILEGLLIAIRNIDEVVKIIKTSKTTPEARDRLRQKFKLSERQAQAILDLRLARLTSLEVFKIEDELAELTKLIAHLEKLIASKTLQFKVVKDELTEIKKKFKIERRSKIISNIDDATITSDDDPKPVDEVVVTLTAAGAIKRMTAKHFSMSKTEFAGGMGLNDVNLVVVQTQTDKLLYIFTNFGNCFKVDVGDIPECKLRDRGTLLQAMFKDAAEGEKPVAVYAVLPPEMCDTTTAGGVGGIIPPTGAPAQIVWLTKLGMIKRSAWGDACGVQKSIFQCYKLREDRPDEVVRVDAFHDGNTIMLASTQGYILNAQTGDVPLQGRIAGGVKGISMADDDVTACACVAKPSGFVVMVTNKGNLKRVESKKIDKMVRYRKGLQFGGALERNERLVFGEWVKGEEDLVIQTDKDEIFTLPVAEIPVTDRVGKWKSFPKIGKVAVTNAYIHRRKKNN